MEAFISDGLRSLITAVQGYTGAENITVKEKTLRWPGHMDAVRPLVRDGLFIDCVNYHCNKGTDMCLMQIDVEPEEKRTGSKPSSYSMVCFGDKDLSAMSKMTAYSCCGFARLILDGWKRGPSGRWIDHVPGGGVHYPHNIGRNSDSVDFILDYLQSKDIDVSDLRD